VVEHASATWSDILAVCQETVRRGIEALATNEPVMKVHGGGAALGRGSADEPGFPVKYRE
jgi:DeoR/GlpR family transcriptional regulator of sugar metabolism